MINTNPVMFQRIPRRNGQNGITTPVFTLEPTLMLYSNICFLKALISSPRKTRRTVCGSYTLTTRTDITFVFKDRLNESRGTPNTLARNGAIPTADLVRFERLAEAVVNLYRSGDRGFRQHIKNRFNRVKERTGIDHDPGNFDTEMAHAFVADELGFRRWSELMDAATDVNGKPILFHYAVAAMDRGDFTALEEAIGSDRLHDEIVEWLEGGFASNEQDTFDEIFAAGRVCLATSVRLLIYWKRVSTHMLE
jgi:hypothetical protein